MWRGLTCYYTALVRHNTSTGATNTVYSLSVMLLGIVTVLCGEIPSLARVLPAATHRLSEWFGGAVLLSCLPVRLCAFKGATGKSEGPQANQDGRAAVGTRALGRLLGRAL